MNSSVHNLMWWKDPAYLQRFISDLIFFELSQLRFANVIAIQRPWPLDTRIDIDLGADSLELLSLGTALSEALHLHESGIEDALLARRSLGDWVDTAQKGLEYFSQRLTFRTSGSSGTPKACAHDFSALWQEVEELSPMFEGRHRLYSAVPSHHIYGFIFTILLPQALGISSGNVIDLRSSSPARLSRDLQPGDLVVGHPEFWHAFGRTVPHLAANIYGVTSTAPCPDHVSYALQQAGLATFFHIYGSTESAGIGWRTDLREPYQLFSYLSFTETEQPSTLLRSLPGGSNVCINVQDELQPQNQQSFLVGPRHDAAVQVGGINVFPQKVQNLLEQHPKISKAVVRLMRQDEGSRLKAFIVPDAAATDEVALKRELQNWFETVLTVHEIPKAITFGLQLPRSASGKLSDWIID